MQDPRALNNTRNLKSWRAWQAEASQRSGFMAATVAAPMLAPFFVITVMEYARAPGHSVAGLMIGLGVYLAIVFALMGFGISRLTAWRRAHPWTPPS